MDRIVYEPQWTDQELGLKLRLQKDVLFHDGTPLDIGSFREILEKVLKTPQPPGTNVSYGSVTKVSIDPEASDSVIIHLSRREAFLPTDLANSNLRHPKNEWIGTGPFKFVDTGPTPKLVANPSYYRGLPEIEQVEVERFPDQRASWAALMRGDIDAVNEIAPNAVELIEREQGVRTYSFLRPYYFQLLFNVHRPVLKSAAVRQALSYAVDRQAVVDLALSKLGTAAEGPIWPYHWAYSTAQKVYSHNLEAATLRLDSAGLKLKAAEKGRMPSRFRFQCLTLAKDARYEKIALVLQKQLYEIGVDMEIVTLPQRELMARLVAKDFDSILIERTSGRSLAWAYLSFHSSQGPSGYTAADEVLNRLRSTTAEASIRTLVSDLQQILHDDPPAIFIAWPQVARVASARFEVPPETRRTPNEGGRDVLSSFWQWKPIGPGR